MSLDAGPRRLRLKLMNTHDVTTKVVVEPWAHEFEMKPDAELEMVIEGAEADHNVSIDLSSAVVTLWVNTGTVVSASVAGEAVWPA